MCLAKATDVSSQHVRTWTQIALCNSRNAVNKSSARMDETLPVVAMCVDNPDRSAFTIQRCDIAVARPGFVNIVGNQRPILYARAVSAHWPRSLIRCCIYSEPRFDLLRRDREVLSIGGINCNCDLSSQNFIHFVWAKKECRHDGRIAFAQKFIDC